MMWRIDLFRLQSEGGNVCERDTIRPVSMGGKTITSKAFLVDRVLRWMTLRESVLWLGWRLTSKVNTC